MVYSRSRKKNFEKFLFLHLYILNYNENNNTDLEHLKQTILQTKFYFQYHRNLQCSIQYDLYNEHKSLSMIKTSRATCTIFIF